MFARIKYSKSYPACLIGHLDTMSSLKRCMRRAFWPVKFTLGYNPRIKLSSAPPLSLGFKSRAEFLDVELASILRKYKIDDFKKKTIKGIKIEYVEVFRHNAPRINEILDGFRYKIKFKGQPDILESEYIDIIEKDDDYAIIDITKNSSGGISNPGNFITAKSYAVIKTDCIWKNRKEKK
ncbi:MAG: TIGR03936 family radical SAM-associated protein [Elusimicrobiota bacterium]